MDHGGDFLPLAQEDEHEQSQLPTRARSGKLYVHEMDIMIRHGFVRKVFGILLTQLIVTFSIVLLFNAHEGARDFASSPSNRSTMVYGGMFASFGTLLPLVCNRALSRRVPTNYILLSIFTLGESFMLGTLGPVVDTTTLLLAMGTTFAIVVGVMLFACQTKHDFTGFAVYGFLIIMLLLMVGFIGSMSTGSNTLYSAAGVGVFSFFIVIDTQMIIGGNHSMKFSVEDYVAAAITLYLDIINLFLHILRLLNDR